MAKPYTKYNRKRIEVEDDIVMVFKDGKEIYTGMEDYEPMKDEDWRWDESKKAYTLNDPRTNGQEYIKICLDV